MVKCPNCEVVMNEVIKTGINIDVCPKCMGVWLDKGELDKIIERSKEEESYNSSNRYTREGDSYRRGDHHDHDDHNEHDREKYYDNKGYPRKRKGFLGDLFDF